MFERLPDKELAKFEMQVYACDNDARPNWLYDASGSKTTTHLNEGIRPVCKILGDLSGLRSTLKQLSGAHGKPYWQINYSVEIFFGQTSLCAELTWKENVSTIGCVVHGIVIDAHLGDHEEGPTDAGSRLYPLNTAFLVAANLTKMPRVLYTVVILFGST